MPHMLRPLGLRGKVERTMNPVDERFEHRLLDRFHYDDRQDGDGYGPDSPRVGDKGCCLLLNCFVFLSNPML